MYVVLFGETLKQYDVNKMFVLQNECLAPIYLLICFLIGILGRSVEWDY